MNNESVCLCGEVLKPFSIMCVFTQRHCDTEKKKKKLHVFVSVAAG